LGKYINNAFNIVKSSFDFSNDINKKAYEQFFFSSISLNIPYSELHAKSYSLHDFDSEVFPNRLEVKAQNNFKGDENEIRMIYEKIFANEINSKEKVYNEESTFAEKINLIIDFSKYLEKLEESNTVESFIKIIKNSLFSNILEKYTKNDLVLGGYDSYIEILKKGNFYENFKPNKNKFSGLPINLNLDIKRDENKVIDEKLRKLNDFITLKNENKINNQVEFVDEFTMFTGRFSVNNINLRTLSKINKDKIFNFKKNIFTEANQNTYYRVPIFNGKSLIEASDGFQFSTDKDSIFYYDKFTTNVLKFEYVGDNSFSNINCNFYQLANTVETPLEEDVIGDSDIIKNFKSKYIFIYIFNIFHK